MSCRLVIVKKIIVRHVGSYMYDAMHYYYDSINFNNNYAVNDNKYSKSIIIILLLLCSFSKSVDLYNNNTLIVEIS